MKMETEKFGIGELTDPYTKEKIVVNQKYPYEFRVFDSIEECKAATKDAWTDKDILEAVNAKEKANARQNESQKISKTFYKDPDTLSDEQKNAIAFEAAVKATMKATKTDEATARAILSAAMSK